MIDSAPALGKAFISIGTPTLYEQVQTEEEQSALDHARARRQALAEAQARNYAEPDPSDDVEAHDVVAKARILAATAFGESIAIDDVYRRGIAHIPLERVQQAVRDNCRIKLVATVRLSPRGRGSEAKPLDVQVEPVALPLHDPLSRVDGVMNALTLETDTVSEVTIIGPGAGAEQAGQGVFADLVSVARAV